MSETVNDLNMLSVCLSVDTISHKLLDRFTLNSAHTSLRSTSYGGHKVACILNVDSDAESTTDHI